MTTLKNAIELELYRYAQNGYKSKEHVKEAKKAVIEILVQVLERLPEKKTILTFYESTLKIAVEAHNAAIDDMRSRLEEK